MGWAALMLQLLPDGRMHTHAVSPTRPPDVAKISPLPSATPGGAVLCRGVVKAATGSQCSIVRDAITYGRTVVSRRVMEPRSFAEFAKCYVCGELFPSDQELDQHLECRHAADLVPYRCASCAHDRCLPIRSMRAINKHFALHDVHERQHKCGYCALRFRTVRNLQSHVRLYHRGGHA
uniref:C2H2-type domain-containing protein n=1 Tax=Anopheles dirus TaxID=7168 RepID=A0A182N6J7_9DIPT